MKATINFYESDRKLNLELIDIRYDDECVKMRASNFEDSIQSAPFPSNDIECISIVLERKDIESIEITEL